MLIARMAFILSYYYDNNSQSYQYYHHFIIKIPYSVHTAHTVCICTVSVTSINSFAYFVRIVG